MFYKSLTFTIFQMRFFPKQYFKAKRHTDTHTLTHTDIYTQTLLVIWKRIPADSIVCFELKKTV